MPSTSLRQKRFMQAVAHDPQFAAKAGVPQSVGQEFASADEGARMRHTGSDKQKTSPGFSRGAGGTRTVKKGRV